MFRQKAGQNAGVEGSGLAGGQQSWASSPSVPLVSLQEKLGL